MIAAQTSPRKQPRPPLFYNRAIFRERDAWRLHNHCVRAIQYAAKNQAAVGSLQIESRRADIVTLFDVSGRLVRYWVRHPIDKRLCLVGTMDGLLPINVEAIHGRA